MTTTVYAFIQSGKGTDWVHGMALDEHGVVVAEHASSSDATPTTSNATAMGTSSSSGSTTRRITPD